MNGAPRFLVVDDDAGMRELVRNELLTDFPGAAVTEIDDAEGLSRAMAAGEFDAVVTDYDLGWDNGLSVLRAAKTRKPDVPVVMFTGTGSEEIAVDAMKAGLDDYVLKSPKHLVRLAPSVRLALEKNQERRALREAERRYLELLRSVPIAICEAAADGTILAGNPALAEMLALPAGATVEGRNLETFLPAEAERRSLFRRAAREGVARVEEMQLRRHGGDAGWVRMSLRALLDESGAIRSWEAALEDVTEQRRTARHLAAEHAVSRVLAEGPAVVEAIPGILRAVCETLGWELGIFWDVDERADMVRCTHVWRPAPIASECFGRVSREVAFARGEAIPGRVWADALALWLEDFQAEAGAARARAAAHDDLRTALAFPVCVGTKVLGVVELFTRETRPPDAELLGVVAAIGTQIGQFIERRRTDEQLRLALLRAEESDRLKSAFLANMSHEIRTPLNVILGYEQVMRDTITSREPAEKRLAAGVHRAARRLMHTVESILDLARLNADTFNTHPVALRLRPIVEGAVADVNALAAEKGLALRTEIGDPDAIVCFDRYCLSRALAAVLDNAIKFTPHGEIVVRLFRTDRGRLALEVRDTGVGIDEAFLPRVFEAFSQEEVSFTRPFEGPGTGLALARGLLARSGGEIRLESRKGGGTTVTIRFPMDRERMT